MACIRKRRGKWVVDYRDAAGTRRWVTCETKREAEDVLAKALPASRQPVRCALDPNLTFTAYGERWLGLVAATVKARSLKEYRRAVERHLAPTLGPRKLRDLERATLKALLAAKLTAGGLAPASVAVVYAVLHMLLDSAVDDGVLTANPAAGLGKRLKLGKAGAARDEAIRAKAMTAEQLRTFLAAAPAAAPRHADLFLLLAHTGLRLGEAVGLQWADLDLDARTLRVARTISGRRHGTPKSGQARVVDLSRVLVERLRRLEPGRKAETLKRGWREVPPWVFVSLVGTPVDVWKAEKVFKRVLKAATPPLPLHFSPHSLRHTYASLLIADGVSPAYVQRQLGHSSIKMTVDTYGKWLPMADPGAVDRLATLTSGSRVVATGTDRAPSRPQVPDSLRVMPLAASLAGRRGGSPAARRAGA